jgi:hypothetical protein
LDGLLSLIIAQRANKGRIGCPFHVSAKHKIGVVSYLSHASNQSKDIGVVIEDDALIDIGVELSVRVAVDGCIEVFFLLVEVISPNFHNARRQSKVICTFKLGSSQHDLAENQSEFTHCNHAVPFSAITLNLPQKRMIEEVEMMHDNMTALVTMTPVGKLPVVRRARALDAKILAKRFNSQKSNERVNLTNSILQRSPRQAQAVL